MSGGAGSAPAPATGHGPQPGEIWARVGGGCELVGGSRRHGPADPGFPPPGSALQPLMAGHRLVGWAERADPESVRRACAEGDRIVEERRTHLLGRLGHKLRSSVLSLQAVARQAAFGRPELLSMVHDQAEDVGRRAAALEVVALPTGEPARAVVLGMLLNSLGPRGRVPSEAVVLVPERALHEALRRALDWAGDGATLGAEKVGAWWRLDLDAAELEAPAVPEFGEPLVRMLVDVGCDGWLEVAGSRLSLWLPAAAPR